MTAYYELDCKICNKLLVRWLGPDDLFSEIHALCPTCSETHTIQATPRPAERETLRRGKLYLYEIHHPRMRGHWAEAGDIILITGSTGQTNQWCWRRLMPDGSLGPEYLHWLPNLVPCTTHEVTTTVQRKSQ